MRMDIVPEWLWLWLMILQMLGFLTLSLPLTQDLTKAELQVSYGSFQERKKNLFPSFFSFLFLSLLKIVAMIKKKKKFIIFPQNFL